MADLIKDLNIAVPENTDENFLFYFLMYYLQKEADLTYIECRAVLRDYSGDTTTSLGQEFNCYINAIYEFEKKGIDKINGRFKLRLTPNLDR